MLEGGTETKYRSRVSVRTRLANWSHERRTPKILRPSRRTRRSFSGENALERGMLLYSAELECIGLELLGLKASCFGVVMHARSGVCDLKPEAHTVCQIQQLRRSREHLRRQLRGSLRSGTGEDGVRL